MMESVLNKFEKRVKHTCVPAHEPRESVSALGYTTKEWWGVKITQAWGNVKTNKQCVCVCVCVCVCLTHHRSEIKHSWDYSVRH